jgi:hypothetical protein
MYKEVRVGIVAPPSPSLPTPCSLSLSCSFLPHSLSSCSQPAPPRLTAPSPPRAAAADGCAPPAPRRDGPFEIPAPPRPLSARPAHRDDPAAPPGAAAKTPRRAGPTAAAAAAAAAGCAVSPRTGLPKQTITPKVK